MVRLVACGADCLGDISDGGDVADIVHQKVNQFLAVNSEEIKAKLI